MLTPRLAATLLCVAQAWGQGVGLWENRAPLPIAATEVSSAAIGDKVYLTCGITPDGLRSRRLFIYDTVRDAWSEGAPLPIALGADHCNLASVNGKLYFAGGIRIGRGFLTNQTFEYDPATNVWTERAKMTVPRGGSGVAVIGSKIYVAGGEGAQQSGTAFEVYDTERNRWDNLAVLPGRRTHLTAQAVGGKVYAIGGRVGGINTVQPDTLEYDPATNVWTRKARMPTARGGIASGLVHDRIIVFGGEGPSGRPEGTYAQVEEYDPATNTWRTLAPMPFPRHGFYGAVVGQRVFLPGGGPRAGGTFSQTHDVFYLDPATAPRIGAVVNAASLSEQLAEGTLVSLFGANLAYGSSVSTALPLPVRLNAVEVRLNGTPVPLLFVGPGQINFFLPLGVGRNVEIETSNVTAASAPLEIELREAAPAIFTLTQDGSGQAAALVAGTGLVAGEFPGVAGRNARPGEILEVFCTGLGPVTNPPGLDEAALSDPLARTQLTVTARIGSEVAEVLFSGLAPGFVGVYQVDVRIPDGIEPGDAVTIEFSVGDQVSNQATIGVSP